MEDDRSCSCSSSGSVRVEEHCEEDDVGRWNSNSAQSQELECAVREEQAYALSLTHRCSCFEVPADRLSRELSGSL